MFANPWALIVGAAAAALPVVIHWLTRPRPTTIAVSTLRFIQGAVAQRRARYRLRDLLVLLFRTAAILLLASAIARPLLHQQESVSAATPSKITRIVLLDCSQSMAAREGGVLRFERARPIVSDLLKFESQMSCNLLLAGADSGRVFDGPTTNLTALRDALTEAEVRPESLNVGRILSDITAIFEQADPDSRLELFIVSDFQRSNWGTADFSVLPKSCDIRLESVATAIDTANLALLDVKSVGRIEVGREAEITMRLGNYSDTARTVRVEVTLDSVVLPFEGHCRPRSETSFAGRVPINSDGWHTGSARIVSSNDALSADDAVPVGLRAWPQPRIAILTRDRVDETGSTAWFVERAVLATLPGSTSDDVVFRIDAADPDVEELRTADIVVLARSGRFSTDLTNVLTAMLQRGKSILWFVGDQLDVSNLRDLSASLGSDIRMPVDFFPRASDRSAANRFLTSVDRRRSPFLVFGDELAAAIGSLEFTGGLVTRANSAGLVDDIRAVLSDQSAFLIVTAAGRGRMAIINADIERSNLARTPVMVPLIAELLKNELAEFDGNQQKFRCGEPFALQLPVGEEYLEDLAITGPDGTPEESAAGTLTAVPGGVVWNVTAAGAAGVYQVRLGEQTVGAAVTAIPEEESDLRTIPENVFAERLSGDRQLSFNTRSALNSDAPDTTWVWLLTACMGCVLAELLTLRVFRA